MFIIKFIFLKENFKTLMNRNPLDDALYALIYKI